MLVSHLVPLRQKIKSVQATKKITHAVRLVSMSLYNKLDKLNVPLQDYAMQIKTLFASLVPSVPSWKNNVLFPRDLFDERPLYIIVATSKGLCGSLNSNLFRYIQSALFLEVQQKPQFIAIGTRAIKFVKDHNLGELVAQYQELNSSNFIAIADDLITKITGQQRYSTVAFFSSEAKSFFVQKPKKFTLIPVSSEFSEAHDGDEEKQVDDGNVAPIWEQDHSVILDTLATKFLRSAMMNVLFQALRAEHAARFMAMENSTNNAEQYLEKLTLQFNKLRQTLITKEVSELSATFTTRY